MKLPATRNDVPVLNPLELIETAGDQLVTTSIHVAQVFGRKHKNVLRAIDGLACSDGFRRLNFEPADFIDKNGDVRRMFRMTKNGFLFLVCGFTGELAGAIKEAYIAAFDAMRELLMKGAVSARRAYDDAWLEAKADEDYARRCGRGLSLYRSKKRNHEKRLKLLHPQLPLLLT